MKKTRKEGEGKKINAINSEVQHWHSTGRLCFPCRFPCRRLVNKRNRFIAWPGARVISEEIPAPLNRARLVAYGSSAGQLPSKCSGYECWHLLPGKGRPVLLFALRAWVSMSFTASTCSPSAFIPLPSFTVLFLRVHRIASSFPPWVSQFASGVMKSFPFPTVCNTKNMTSFPIPSGNTVGGSVWHWL